MYAIRDFLSDCYEAAEKQGAYKLDGEEQARACIQAFRYVMANVYETYGIDGVIRMLNGNATTDPKGIRGPYKKKNLTSLNSDLELE